MKAVVVGGSGQIGGWLLRHLRQRGHEAVGTYATRAFPGLIPLAEPDRPEAAAWLVEQAPDIVFYPAGFTWVDQCERDPDHSRRANLDQPLALARVVAERGGRFVYVSTDYVFDGVAGPYPEFARTNPLNAYGRAKLEAERALTELLGDRLLLVRTCWVFGPERQGKNFAYQAVRTLRQGQSLTCPSDQRSTPSYAPDVARVMVELAEEGASGLIHVAGPETMDRPRFARVIAESFGLDPGRIEERPTAELGQAATRPLRGGLATVRLDQFLPGAVRSLDAALADFRACLAGDPEWADPLAPGEFA